MDFKECYLIPKELYDHQVKAKDRSSLPADVRLKLLDHQKRFQTAVPPKKEDEESRLEQQIQTILGGIPDVTRKNLASQILTFIVSKGGGSIRWTDDFGVLLDNQRLYNLDIRQAIRHLVGANPDFKRESLPIYERLLALGMKPTLLMFYNDEAEYEDDDISSPASEERWDSEGEEKWEDAWAPVDSEEKKNDVHQEGTYNPRQRTHTMALRTNRAPKWRTYNF